MMMLGLGGSKLARIGALATALVALLAIDVPVAEPATTFTVLYNNGAHTGDPLFPYRGVLAEGRDGNLYTTSQSGGAHNQGTVFQLTPAGQVKVIHSFNLTDGSQPTGGLTLGTDGNLYGTTFGGGPLGRGIIFKMTTGGTLTVLHIFDESKQEGEAAIVPPIQGRDGNFYGTTNDGGLIGVGVGTLYKLTPSGTFTVLHRFSDRDDNGQLSFPASLTLGTDGNLYGTTTGVVSAAVGGSFGAVFKITTSGTFTLLHTFNSADGSNPVGPLVQASDGNFYGTTWRGGKNGVGTVYRMTPAGVVSDVFSFPATGVPGYKPLAGVVQATNGNLYGGAFGGRGGDLFQLTLAGSFTNLHTFNITDGSGPYNTMIQHTNGSLYGVTYEGGTGGVGGVAYRLNVGVGPFVRFLPTQSQAKVGASIQLFGTGFSKATAVAFGGAPASFTIVSDTFMTAVVPSAAKTGALSVSEGATTLSSNQKFRVAPQVTSFTPTSGAVGASVTVTGQSLAQTTAVTFGGVKAASFTIVSNTQVKATVPTGAKTGKIGVSTAGGSASSATTFTVTP